MLPSVDHRWMHLPLGAVGVLCLFVAGTSFPLRAQSFVTQQSASAFETMTERLMQRMAAAYAPLTHERAALSAAARQELLAHEMTVTFDVPEGSPAPAPYRLRMRDHPDWIAFRPESGVFEVDEYAVRMYLEEHADAMLPLAHNAIARDPSIGWVERYEVVGNPQEGYSIDPLTAAERLMRALEQRETSAVIEVTHELPTLFVRTASGTIQLERLSRGISDFTGSSYGRSANVRKALEGQLRGVMIHPGERFSFGATLQGSIGWRDAYVIANGGELVMEPGGGICQAATTAFRAAVLAGLPIEERANHSLYVTYYRSFGVGIDATYYPEKQDFVFRNDTAHPMMLVAYADDTTAVVELYGVADGRSVAVSGPYFASKAEAAAEERALDLKANQIGWLYDVTYPDGTVKEDAVVSTYKAIPRLLSTEYETHPGIDELLGKTGTGGTAVFH